MNRFPASRFLALTALLSFALLSLCPASPAPAFADDVVPVKLKRVVRLQESGGRVSVRPADGRIAFDRLGKGMHYDVWTMNPDGTDLRPLTAGRSDVPQAGNGQPVWHPSGQWIVFQSRNPELKSLRLLGKTTEEYLTNPGAGLQNDLWVVDAEGKKAWPLTKVQDRGGVLHAHFSPDGGTMAWTEHLPKAPGRPKNHWVIRLADFRVSDGKPALSNIRTLRPDNLEFYEVHSFSPDGRRLLYCGSAGENYFGLELYIMDLDARQARRLTDDDEWDEHAHFSPDGRYIAWASSRGIAQEKKGLSVRLDYWIMRADGTGAKRLTRFNEPGAPEAIAAGAITSDLDWNADGKSFVAFVQIYKRRAVSPVMRIELEGE